MFTGIIETIGVVKSIKKNQNNLILEIASSISKNLKPDQSVAHNGICLTIIKKTNKTHFVTAIEETISKTNLSHLKVGDIINLERSLVIGQRLDGHFVTGHIDTCSKILELKVLKGSLEVLIELSKEFKEYIIHKGSITINGVSLTVNKLKKKSFTVYIIPYTMEHTNFKNIAADDYVNVEFDLFGKYIHKMIHK